MTFGGPLSRVVHHFLGMPSSAEGLASHKIPYFTDLSWKIYNLKFALIDSSKPSAMTKSQALQSNLDVDYVISYRFAKTGMRHVNTPKHLNANCVADKTKAAAQFEKLCHALASVGLQTEARNGDNHSVLLFVRVASDEHLFGEVYRSR